MVKNASHIIIIQFQDFRFQFLQNFVVYYIENEDNDDELMLQSEISISSNGKNNGYFEEDVDLNLIMDNEAALNDDEGEGEGEEYFKQDE